MPAMRAAGLHARRTAHAPSRAPHQPAAPLAGWRGAVWLLWAVLAFALLPVGAGTHAIRMATAFEVCGSFGARLVDPQGEPVSAQDHRPCDGCLTPPLALPPAPFAAVLAPATPRSQAVALTAARLGSEWLAPLSRGPPARG